MQLHYSIRREEWVRAIEAVVGTLLKSEAHAAGERRRTVLGYARNAVWLIALGSVAWVYPEALRPLLIFAALALIVWTVAEWAIARVPTAIGTTYHPRRHEGLRAEMGGEGFILAGAEHCQNWHRSLLKDFHELPEIYVLEFIGSDMMVVPKRAFASQQGAAGWAEEMRRSLASDTIDRKPSPFRSRILPTTLDT